jgi:DnaJ-class molecular chaperone
MSEFANKMKAALGRKPDPDNLCRDCGGRGQTKATSTETKTKDGKVITTALGSGCPACRGRGQV